MIPAFVSVFNYDSNRTTKEILSAYIAGTITPAKIYTIINNNSVHDIRKATMSNIAGTETTVVNINDITISNGETRYYETTNDSAIDKILYTTYETNEEVNNLAYLRYYNGHCEIVFIAEQSILSTGRIVLVVIEDANHNVITSTTPLNADDEYDRNIESTYMRSSSSKVVRVLMQKSSDEDVYQVKPFDGYFEYVDLGILELITTFDKRLSAKWSSDKIFEFLDNYKFGRIKDKTRPGYSNLQYFSHVIADLTDCIDSL